MKNSSLPVKPIRQIRDEVYDICGIPAKPKLNRKKVVAIVKWIDGTVIDSLFQVKQ